MKKLIVFITLLVSSFFALAQDPKVDQVNDSLVSKYESATNVESRFYPFSGQSINNLRFRFFGKSQAAFRVNMKFNHASDNSERFETDVEGEEVELKTNNSETEFELSLGGEYHWKRGSKVSPYIGGDFTYGSKTTKSNVDDYIITTTDRFGDPLDEEIGSVVVSKFENSNNSGFHLIGLSFIMGVDYYFSEKIYLGTELKVGLSRTTFKRSRLKVGDDLGNSTAPTIGPAVNFGTGSVANIRFGFFF